MLIMETGHHKVSDVLDYAESMNVGKLIFNHNGREIIENKSAAQAQIAARGANAVIAIDCQTVEI